MGRFIILLCLIFGIISCAEPDAQVMTIEDTKNIIQANQSVEYDYIAEWDTPLNNTKRTDTTFVQKQLATSNIHGFQIYLSKKGYKSFYDAMQQLQLDHKKQLLISSIISRTKESEG